MSGAYPARSIAFVALAIVLPLLVMSCSRRVDHAVAEKGESDKADHDGQDMRLDKAIAEYTEAIRLHPEQGNDRGELPHVQRGRAYAEKGELDKAIADFTEAIRLYPIAKPPYLDARLAEAYSARGESYLKKREYDPAIADFTQIIDSNKLIGHDKVEVLAFAGFRATAHYKRGVCYDEKGDHSKAVADFNEAVRLGPDLDKNEDLKRRMNK
jgi:tetratricopeptide (TPR) repeat protein